jgi:hypothetical protein
VATVRQLSPEERAFLDKWFPGKKLTPQQINVALDKRARSASCE